MAQDCRGLSNAAISTLVRCDDGMVGQCRRVALESLVKYETLIEIIELDYDDMFTDGQLDKEEDDE